MYLQVFVPRGEGEADVTQGRALPAVGGLTTGLGVHRGHWGWSCWAPAAAPSGHKTGFALLVVCSAVAKHSSHAQPDKCSPC